ncbi:MAG: membrane dipeptidase, partial [Chloroflexota bacterium]
MSPSVEARTPCAGPSFVVSRPLHSRSACTSENPARVAASADAIEAAKRDGVLAIVPCVENGFAVGTDLGRLAEFRARGARYLTLTHNGHNAL